MAAFKYFSDANGATVELQFVTSMDNKEFSTRFPGVRGMRYDGYSMWVGRADAQSDKLPVTRKIEMKRNPSRHVCNAKCVGGQVNGRCECQCGGKNHGAGMFTRLLAAA